MDFLFIVPASECTYLTAADALCHGTIIDGGNGMPGVIMAHCCCIRVLIISCSDE